MQFDVVVVGAGFAGLSAARELVALGRDVVVLEASGRVGGRTDTQHDQDRLIELGGQWTGPGQDRVLALAAELGVDTFQTPHVGADLSVVSGVVTESSRDANTAGVAATVEQLDVLAADLPAGEPWRVPEADHLDTLTVDDWLTSEIGNDGVRALLRQMLEGLMTTRAEDMSLLTILHSARTSGSLSAALGIEGGAQESRLVGGMHQMAVRLADELGARVRLGHPVIRIDQESKPGCVVIQTSTGHFEAAHVVVAVPPARWREITFAPALPAAHAQLPDAMPMGSVVKMQMVFDRPFWRAAGWSGLVTDDSGPFAFMVDNSQPGTGEGVLATFLSARAAVEFGDASLGVDAQLRRRELLLSHVVHVFGPDVPDPTGYVDRDWGAVPWIGGGYSGVMRPGGWASCGSALREPVGRIHWASSESATMWTGYVEGAIESGRRAAGEID